MGNRGRLQPRPLDGFLPKPVPAEVRGPGPRGPPIVTSTQRACLFTTGAKGSGGFRCLGLHFSNPEGQASPTVSGLWGPPSSWILLSPPGTSHSSAAGSGQVQRAPAVRPRAPGGGWSGGKCLQRLTVASSSAPTRCRLTWNSEDYIDRRGTLCRAKQVSFPARTLWASLSCWGYLGP